MQPTSTGTYRVFERDSDDRRLLVDPESGAPAYVRTDGYDEPLQSRVESLEPGNLTGATIAWGEEPRFADLSIRTRTRFEFVDGTPDIFEAARRAFEGAQAEGEPVASRVTRDTDGEPNGALYTIAEQSGETDVFAELRDGRMTLEPFVDRLDEAGGEPPYEVFVIRPGDDPFVVVYLVLEKGGLLAETIRDEYGPRRQQDPSDRRS